MLFSDAAIKNLPKSLRRYNYEGQYTEFLWRYDLDGEVRIRSLSNFVVNDDSVDTCSSSWSNQHVAKQIRLSMAVHATE
jgi:hypothetical protein